jgi:hypothetical protein
MGMSNGKTRITVFVADELAKKFTGTMRTLGISGTAFLSRTLPAELDYLAKLPANSERAAAVWRFMYIDTEDAPSKVRRFNITLDRGDAERMDQLCREKRVDRDNFIGVYLDFLVNGAEGVCEAPLKKVSEMLMNPRHEYEEKRKNAPTSDEEFYNSESSEFMTIKVFPEENPYSVFHIDEEQLKPWERWLKKNRTPENR